MLTDCIIFILIALALIAVIVIWPNDTNAEDIPLIIILGIIVTPFVLLVRWIRRKSMEKSMKWGINGGKWMRRKLHLRENKNDYGNLPVPMQTYYSEGLGGSEIELP